MYFGHQRGFVFCRGCRRSQNYNYKNYSPAIFLRFHVVDHGTGKTRIPRCKHRKQMSEIVGEGGSGGPSMMVTIWLEMFAYTIYLEGPESPEYVMHHFYLK